jgi:hypothetical protein
MENEMNRTFAAVIVATSLATPAIAQSWDPDLPSGNVGPAPYGANVGGFSTYRHSHKGFRAHAQAYRHHGARSRRSDGLRNKW